jgi:hypothetical protein
MICIGGWVNLRQMNHVTILKSDWAVLGGGKAGNQKRLLSLDPSLMKHIFMIIYHVKAFPYSISVYGSSRMTTTPNKYICLKNF